MDDIVILPAQPGFTVIQGDIEVPVVGWAVRPGTIMAVPIVADHVSAEPGTVLKHPGGYMDAKTGMTHSTYRDWESSQEGGQEPPKTSGGSTPASDANKAPTPSPRTAQAPGAVGPYRIPFGGKTYKLVSFWRYHGEEGDFIFQVPAETATPSDSRCQKVNRDEFAKLKKDGLPVSEYRVVRGLTSQDQTAPLDLGEPDANPGLDAAEAEAAPPNTADPDEDLDMI